MKKLLIILLMLFPLVAESATITATKAGNWSDTSVWDLGRIPAAGDDVALAGYDIVWDTGITRIPATGTLTSISSTGTDGQITLALDNAAFHNGAGLYATTITAGTKPATIGLLYITGSTDHVLTIVGNIVGGSNSNAYCIHHNSTGTLNIIGSVTGGTSTSPDASGLLSASSGAISINGDVYASATGLALKSDSTAQISISGNVSGGGATSAYGIYNASTGKITLSSSSNIINGSYGPALIGLMPAWNPAVNSYVKYYVGAGFGQAANTEFKRPQTTGAAQ